MATLMRAARCVKAWPELDVALAGSLSQVSTLNKIFVQRYQTSCLSVERKQRERNPFSNQDFRRNFHQSVKQSSKTFHESRQLSSDLISEQYHDYQCNLSKLHFSHSKHWSSSTHSHHWMSSRQSQVLTSDSHFKNPLLGVTMKPLLAHQFGQSTLSPTQAILRSSPMSVQPYLRLIRFDRPIGTWLLYWPCTWSIALAAQPGCMPDLKMLALFGAGAFFMRGAGCIINDMWDKDFDAKVERTKLRPLAAGELTQFQALVFLGTQLSCALAILLQLNWYSVILGASSMGLVVLYPLAKRYTYWPQLVLGLTLNWGVLLGWSQLHGCIEPPALALYVACTLYTMIYDSIYSHQDKYDDMLIGVKSTALKLGDQTKPWLTGFTLGMTGGLMAAGLMCDMTWPYYLAVAITTGRLGQQIYSTDLNNADHCASAFRGNFYLGAVMFAGIVLANILKAKTGTDEDTPEEQSLPVA